MNRRRGISLIEMLVVITVGSTLSGIAIFLLYALTINHNSGREQLEYCRTINRLAEQFRCDVHSMQQTSPENKEAVFDLLPGTTKDAKFRYRCLKDRIDRCELQGEKIVRQESYLLPPDMESSIKTESRQVATIACIMIAPKVQTQKYYQLPPTRIEAVLDRDSRLIKVLTTTKKEDNSSTENPPTEKTPTENPPAEKPATEQPATEVKP
jgi:prepilin-type N-terminal cleavage/methylation domain-containing protein